ncbi:MAG: acyltransferase [Planctomycetes bacterium]|nr:acyltransferase [Planctomycetota bacterium]
MNSCDLRAATDAAVEPIAEAGHCPPPRHLPALDGLRALAVLLVLWDHAPGALQPAWLSALAKWRNPGNFGVDLFFVLSGFLITRILLAERKAGVPVRYFLARRACRIFPIYYLLLAAIALVRPTPELGWCALYLSNLSSALFVAPPSGLHHTWSLCVEEHFYALWPLLVSLLAPATSRRLIARVVVPGALLAGALLVVLPAIGPLWRPLESAVASGAIDRFDRLGLLLFGTPCRVLSLAIGSLFAYHEAALVARWRRSVAVAALGMAAAALLSTVTPQLCSVLHRAAGSAAGSVAGSAQLLPFPASDWKVLVGVGSTTLASSSALLALLALAGRDSKATRWLGFAPLTAIGRISYGLYLYHLPWLFAFDVHRRARAGETVTVALIFLALFAIATLSYLLIERPILRFARRFREPPRERTRRSDPARGEPRGGERSGATVDAARRPGGRPSPIAHAATGDGG